MNEFFIFEDIEYTEKIPVKYFIAAIDESWAHWHKEIEILFVLSGTLQITVEDTKFDLEANEVILINSNQIHSIRGKDDLTLVLQFVPELIYRIYGNQQIYQFHLNTADPRMEKETTDKLRSILAKIGIEYSRRRDGYKFYLWSHLYELVGYLFRYCNYITEKNDLVTTENLRKISAIIEYLNENYTKQLSITTISEDLYMSDLTLSKFFKEKTGFSILLYLQILRINHAKQLLVSSDASIIDIANECGFYSMPTFYRVFNKIVGCSPSEFKKTREQIVFKDHIQLVQGYLSVGVIDEYALLFRYL